MMSDNDKARAAADYQQLHDHRHEQVVIDDTNSPPRAREKGRSMTDKELIAKATEQYIAWCKRNGRAYDQPNAVRSTVTQRRVNLENVNGLLAVFDRQPGDKLRIRPIAQ